MEKEVNLQGMEIYIKPAKKVAMAAETTVYIKDIAEVFAPSNLADRVKNIKLLKLDTGRKKNYLITVIDIISAIDRTLPGHTINNVGEIDTVLEYCPEKSKDNPVIKWLKIIFVTFILFAGSTTAIMSFHSDAQVPRIFEDYYYMFFNERVSHPMIIDLPYSIGIAVGIIVFFNHFFGKKVTDDPTPIEVEISAYEKEIADNVIDTLNTEKNMKDGDDGGDS